MVEKSLYTKVDNKLQRMAKTLGAITAIAGAAIGASSWVQSQFTNAITSQIDDLKREVQAADDSQNLAIMRLELMNLIVNDPDNVVEIERLGKKYFQAGGDSWMSSYYSRYAAEHGLDTSFIIDK